MIDDVSEVECFELHTSRSSKILMILTIVLHAVMNIDYCVIRYIDLDRFQK